MNTHKILLGALLIRPDLAPYALPDLEIEHFPPDLQPVFAALSGLWNAKPSASASPARMWKIGHRSFGSRLL